VEGRVVRASVKVSAGDTNERRRIQTQRARTDVEP